MELGWRGERVWQQLARLFRPSDVAGLVYFRIAFGAIALWEVWRYADRGYIDELESLARQVAPGRVTFPAPVAPDQIVVGESAGHARFRPTS